MKHIGRISKAMPARGQFFSVPGILRFNEIGDWANWFANFFAGWFGFTVAPGKSGDALADLLNQ